MSHLYPFPSPTASGSPPPQPDRTPLRALRDRLRAGERTTPAPRSVGVSGPVGRLLGERTALVELLPGERTAGLPWGAALSLIAESRRSRDPSESPPNAAVAVIAVGGEFPLTWAAWGLNRVLAVRPRTDRDRLWAIERCLRSGGLAATVAALPRELDSLTARRLKLAAAAGRGTNLLLRSADARREPCWADVRLSVSPLAGPDSRTRDTFRPRWDFAVLRRRGRLSPQLDDRLAVELDDDARLRPVGSLPVVSGLADSAGPPRSASDGRLRLRAG